MQIFGPETENATYLFVDGQKQSSSRLAAGLGRIRFSAAQSGGRTSGRILGSMVCSRDIRRVLLCGDTEFMLRPENASWRKRELVASIPLGTRFEYSKCEKSGCQLQRSLRRPASVRMAYDPAAVGGDQRKRVCTCNRYPHALLRWRRIEFYAQAGSLKQQLTSERNRLR
jgi:hypothetical protein